MVNSIAREAAVRDLVDLHLLKKGLVPESVADYEPVFVAFIASLDNHRGIDILACFEAWLEAR